MTWTLERKRAACVHALTGDAFVREDTTIVARPGWYELVTPSTHGAMLNEVVFSALREDEVDAAIDAALARHPHGLKWWIGPWSEPADLGDRLVRRGYSAWRTLGMGCATDLAIAASDAVTVTPVTEAELGTFVAIASRGWDMDEEQRAHELASHRRALGRGVLLFLAWVDGEPVGTAGVIVKEDHGYLLGAQVLAHARRRGAYRALVAARLEALLAAGRGYAVTYADEETSAPRLAAIGFETLFSSRCYLCTS